MTLLQKQREGMRWLQLSRHEAPNSPINFEKSVTVERSELSDRPLSVHSRGVLNAFSLIDER